MFDVRQTELFADWLQGLRDRAAKARIEMRLRRVALGSLGDVKPVGEGVGEMRIDYGPGYRLYFVRREQIVIILLCGGDKGSQTRDIERALRLAAQI